MDQLARVVDTQDASWYDNRRAREAFAETRNAERWYGIQLRKLARHIDELVRGINPNNRDDLITLRYVLERYSDLVKPWARTMAKRMLDDVSRRDIRAWNLHAKAMGEEMRREILNAPTGEMMRGLMDDQVSLITSLPLQAAQRVHELSMGNLYSGARAAEVAKQLMETGQVTKSRAETIARTEAGRASISFTQARAQFIGSEGYIWRTAGDYKVRPEIGIAHFAQLNTLARGSHRKLEGTFHKWTEPPIAGQRGERAHPGAIYNCRCFAEVVIPERFN